MISIKNFIHNKLYSLLLTKNYIKHGAIVNFGAHTNINGCYISGNIKIGEGTKLSRCEIEGNVTIGRYSSLTGPNLDIRAGHGTVSIGNFCSIARNVSFQVDSHNYNSLSTFPIFKNIIGTHDSSEVIKTGDIIVGHDVWIGTKSIIMGGVSIGNGAIIAANSFVNKDVAEFTIVGGSPAKFIKYRFREDVIIEINKLNWWDWPIEKIKKNIKLFKGNFDIRNGKTTNQ